MEIAFGYVQAKNPRWVFGQGNDIKRLIGVWIDEFYGNGFGSGFRTSNITMRIRFQQSQKWSLKPQIHGAGKAFLEEPSYKSHPGVRGSIPKSVSRYT